MRSALHTTSFRPTGQVYTRVLDVFEEVDVVSRLGGAVGFEREPHERYADTRGD